MPLTKRQFQLGIDEADEKHMRLIYSHLAENPDLAYSIDELRYSVLPIESGSDEIESVDRALDALVGIGAVEAREVGPVRYYAFQQEFDTGTWLSTKDRLRFA